MNKVLSLVKLFILGPLAYVWARVYSLRRTLYNSSFFKSENYQVPVISIGNLTFGGSGKTPFTIWLSEYITSLDLCPMILIRGYKGGLEHSSGMIKGGEIFKFNPIEYGDEALLLAKRLKRGGVVVGKDRKNNLAFYFNQLNPDVVLLDDGYQHLKVGRDLNIVLFDATLPINKYKVAPLGYLREGLSALSDADAVIISRGDQVNQNKIQLLRKLIGEYTLPGIPSALVKYVPSGLFNCSYQKVLNPDQLNGRRVICVAAIAGPQSFFALVESLGADIIERVAYPDHYFFVESDIEEWLNKAEQQDAIIVTSEKDIVKIRRISTDEKILYVEIKVDFIEGQEEFEEMVQKKLPKYQTNNA